jgi:uncharacterized protein (TIGR02679 family)
MTDARDGSSVAARPHEIRQHLGGPVYRKLFDAVRRRLEEAGASARTVTVRGLDEAERRAIADLLGWKTLPADPVRLAVARLDHALRESRLAAGLDEVVEALGGPLVDRRAHREAARAGEEAMWRRMAGHPVVLARPELSRWLDELRALGLLARGAQRTGMPRDTLVDLALQVIELLPAGGVLLAVLAADVTGDAHALDPGQPLAGLVLRAAQHLAGWTALPADAAARRRLWAEVGVLCDPLSAQVLVLGLRPAGDDRLAQHLRAWADAGEPRRLTLRELTGSTLRLDIGAEVFVCENPGVVAAAADRLGSDCAPLVCVEGIPSTAALELLHQLRRHGAQVRFHADFDWTGVRIGNLLTEQHRAAPWRFDAPAYRSACAELVESMPLTGAAVEATWDRELRAAMEASARTIFEEQLIDILISDLTHSARA